MSDEITSELAELIKKGRELVDDLPSLDDHGWIDHGDVDLGIGQHSAVEQETVQNARAQLGQALEVAAVRRVHGGDVEAAGRVLEGAGALAAGEVPGKGVGDDR